MRNQAGSQPRRLTTGFARRKYLQDLRLVTNGIDRLGSGKEGDKEKRKKRGKCSTTKRKV